MRKKSVVLLSGGLDSSANLAFCKEWDHPVLALTIDYGQKAAAAELKAAKYFCDFYQVPHLGLDLKWLGKLGGSALTQSSLDIPEVGKQSLDDLKITQKSAKSVWVPNRNGILINTAAGFAEQLGAEQVVVGFNVEEAATFPDNSAEYLNRVNSALVYSTLSGVKVFSYTLNWNKIQIVKEVAKLTNQFPFDAVWSCYEGGPIACEKCESCQRLARARSALA